MWVHVDVCVSICVCTSFFVCDVVKKKMHMIENGQIVDYLIDTLQTVNHVNEGNNQGTPRGVTLVFP